MVILERFDRFAHLIHIREQLQLEEGTAFMGKPRPNQRMHRIERLEQPFLREFYGINPTFRTAGTSAPDQGISIKASS